MGFKQHISRTWQMIEQQVNDVPFRPDNEAVGRRKEGDRGKRAGKHGAREDRFFQGRDLAVIFRHR